MARETFEANDFDKDSFDADGFEKVVEPPASQWVVIPPKPVNEA